MFRRLPTVFIHYSRTEPARTIITLVAFVTFLSGLWIMTPWFVPVMAHGPAATAAYNIPVVGSAIINCLVCLPAFWAAVRGKHKPRLIARGAWYLFIWYVFVTMTRLVVYGFNNLYFIPVAVIAIILAVLYIEQKFASKVGPSV